MKDKHLQFKIRLRGLTFLKGKASSAKVSFIKQVGDYKEGLWGSANSRDPKIYILKQGKEILYVGITKMTLSNRFRNGLTASGKNGYHGYAWKSLATKTHSREIDLFVFEFSSEERTEAIEAEVVYLIRNKTGKWPKYQTEIHFHQADKTEAKIAESIYKKITASL